MKTFRYIVALVVLISLPPGLLLWFCIHPFAGFWRKLGPVWTYTLLGIPMIGVMVAIGLTLHALSDILNGHFDPILEALQRDEKTRKLTDAA